MMDPNKMGSSKGFMKRNLLRPQSGLSKEREFLKSVDISQSQPMISSTIRSELSVIQQSINLLDKDKRIRSSEPSLQKSYIGVMKKWIRENGSLGAHYEKQDDDKAILKQMGVQSYETGFRKLWKIICNLDLMISKIMELQIVHLVKYDQMFDNIGTDSQVASSMLSAIAKAGFNPAMFHVVRVSLQRSNELYAYASGLKKLNPNSSNSLITQNQTSEMIQQLRSQNKKLTSLLQQLESKPTHSISDHKISHPSSLGQLQAKYKDQIQQLNNKVHKANEEVTELKIEVHSLKKKLAISESEVQDARQQGVFKKQKPNSGSYQQALMEEMDKMKKGFEKKIKRMQQDQQQFERQSRRRQYDYKSECDRIKWEKSLLLKKFDVLSAGKA